MAVLALIPGLLCDPALWRHQVAALGARAECRVADITGADNVAAMAEGVLAGLPERFALVGFSLGGYVALEIMRQAPERVSRLTLMDTKAPPDRPEEKASRRELLVLAGAGRFDEVNRILLPLYLPEARLGDAALTAEILGMAERLGPEVFARQIAAIIGRPDSRPLLPRIACPTLVLCGRQDRRTTLADHEEMAAAIPGARLVVVEDCGHFVQLERPEQVNAALAAWLDGEGD